MNTSSHNLNLYRILFLVKGVLTLCFSLFFIFYGLLGVFVSSTVDATEPDIPFNPGIFFMVIGSVGIIICVILGVLTLMASKYLKEIRNYNFVFAMAIVNCLTGILGILLGVFTLIELNKPEVKALFDSPKDKLDTV